MIGKAQPPPLVPATKDCKAEHKVERILYAENNKQGRGRHREVLIKWTGYADPTWEPRENFKDIIAIDKFKARFGSDDLMGEDNAGAMIGPRKSPRGRGSHLLSLGTASLEWLLRKGALAMNRGTRGGG